MAGLGVHSEVGRLKTVLVHRPGESLERLTPQNRSEYLFDDVVWVERAQREHDYFTDVLRDRGVEVLYLQQLLAETLAASEDACRHIVERAVSSFTVGLSLVEELRGWLFAQEPDAPRRDPRRRAAHLGARRASTSRRSTATRSARSWPTPDSFVLPPLPNTLFMRDSSAWIYGGVILPPLFWHARRLEVSNVSEIYRHHPRFAGADFEFWYPPAGDAERFAVEDFGHGASLEGGDVMPIGNKTVLVGMGERSTGRMVEHIARALFASGQAERIIACRMELARAYMHLDTVIGFVDRDAVTVYPQVIEQMQVFSLRPGDDGSTFDITEEKGLLPAIADALGVERAAGHPDRRRHRSRRLASSGTTRTTSSPSSRASSWPTRATRGPTPTCATPASRSSRSTAPSWARAAAAATA